MQHRSHSLTQTADGNWSWRETREVHTCLDLLWTHMDARISPHVHTETECVSMCVIVDVRGCSLDWGWSSYWWQYGAYRGGELLTGSFSLLGAENPWISSTSPHVLSGCSLQLEASPIHKLYQTQRQCFIYCFITTWMAAILPYNVWLLLASHSKLLDRIWWANNSRGKRDSFPFQLAVKPGRWRNLLPHGTCRWITN